MKYRRRFAALCAVLLLLAAGAAARRAGKFRADCAVFSESSRQLDNPDRGFYSIRGWRLPVTPDQYPEPGEDGDLLEMVQINLNRFRNTPLSREALDSLDGLMDALSGGKTRYILRFLYDWDGMAQGTEPERIETIVTHIRQLAPILREYSDRIFTIQGLFTGNWGEMNNTSFGADDDLRLLAGELAEAAGEGPFLAVRVPAMWRRITGTEAVGQAEQFGPIGSRLGLYNDGILGNAQDCGTYAPGEEAHSDSYMPWNREEELLFQQELCRYVPNGGEVIIDNPWNDFRTALDALKTMHITYLNRDYDPAVLEKWSRYTVEEPGCYRGMDGLHYIERHLGYRYLIDSASLGYSWLRNCVTLDVNLKNTGFAPAYTEKNLILTLRGSDQTVRLERKLELPELPGGNEDGKLLPIHGEFPMGALEEASYRAFLQIVDCASGEPLQLANEQQPETDGYYLGTCSFVPPILSGGGNRSFRLG